MTAKPRKPAGTDEKLLKPSTHGGRRAGSGQKTAAVRLATKDHHYAYTEARAQHERCKAELAQLTVDVKSGKLIPADEVERVVSTAFATISQAIRSIPDNIERQTSPGADVIEAIERITDESLNALADQLAVLSPNEIQA
jgi:hypothetical protein